MLRHNTNLSHKGKSCIALSERLSGNYWGNMKNSADKKEIEMELSTIQVWIRGCCLFQISLKTLSPHTIGALTKLFSKICLQLIESGFDTPDIFKHFSKAASLSFVCIAQPLLTYNHNSILYFFGI